MVDGMGNVSEKESPGRRGGGGCLPLPGGSQTIYG